MGFMSVLMNVNMQIADHSGTFCSSLSGCVQIRGLKEEGDFHHDERQIKKQKSTYRVSVSPCAVFATHKQPGPAQLMRMYHVLTS